MAAGAGMQHSSVGSDMWPVKSYLLGRKSETKYGGASVAGIKATAILPIVWTTPMALASILVIV